MREKIMRVRKGKKKWKRKEKKQDIAETKDKK